MSTFVFEQIGKRPLLRNPVFIEGLPGIGNVGKVAVDFIIDEVKAVKLFEIYSSSFPHSVFVNEDNLVELPKIEIFYKKQKKRDILFLGGDIQPMDEESCYQFSEQLLDLLQSFKVKEIVTLGGIGLNDIPKRPKVFCTANSKAALKHYTHKLLHKKIYGVVGPIVGVSGLLVGLAQKRKINAASFLAETYGHPMYLGVKGAREITKILDDIFGLGVTIDKLEKEIDDIESELLKRTKNLEDVSKQTALHKLKGKIGEQSYIG
ncbi:MAG TPA: PAC2 family protein [Candidatus Nanoarchaeia archaeon]|nr:PAC2 family protein [Candidatus Nanoarchaeia archaeon]